MAKRGCDHVRAQRKGKERDMYTCQVCGSRNNVEGHHIIDVQFGGRASADNIITLCHDCHRKAHDGRLSLFRA